MYARNMVRGGSTLKDKSNDLLLGRKNPFSEIIVSKYMIGNILPLPESVAKTFFCFHFIFFFENSFFLRITS